jgi:hypothetical protein
MSTENFEWHDGTLDSIQINGDGRISIACYLYPSSDAKSRAKFVWDCSGVVSCTCTVDFTALLENKSFGNINEGRFKSAKRGLSILKLFLSDGYVELAAKSIASRKIESDSN